MATALANVVAAEMHHIGSQTCNLENDRKRSPYLPLHAYNG